jgi:hypothetical protein
MEVPSINRFTHIYLAIRKPRKNTLYFIKWSVEGASWTPYTPVTDEHGIQMYRNDYSLAHVGLNLNTDRQFRWNQPTSTRILVNFEAVGKYVKWTRNTSTFTAPVLEVRKIPNAVNAVPAKFKFPEYEFNNATNPFVNTNLWILREAGPPPLAIPTPQRQRRIHTIPKRIAQVILEDAVNKGEVCPITMDDISIDTSKVTSCFHIFDGDAITTWLSRKAECPVCKETCVALTVI